MIAAEISFISPLSITGTLTQTGWSCLGAVCTYPVGNAGLASKDLSTLELKFQRFDVMKEFEVKVTIGDDGLHGDDVDLDNNSGSWKSYTRLDCERCASSWLADFLQKSANVAERIRGLPQAASDMALDLDMFRRFRDEVLMTTPAGQGCARLYYENSPDIANALMANPDLAIETASVLNAWVPNMQAVLNGQAVTTTITLSQTQALDTYLDHLYGAASPKLKQVLIDERAKTSTSLFVGKTVEEACSQVLGKKVYLPIVLRGTGVQAGW